jgi:hypothetical protein
MDWLNSGAGHLDTVVAYSRSTAGVGSATALLPLHQRKASFSKIPSSMPTEVHGVAMENADAQHRELGQPGDSEKRDTEADPVPAPSVELCEEDGYLQGSPLVLLIVGLALAVVVVRLAMY